MPGNPVELTDPRMMRALAHQARIAIWTHLGLRGPATATECVALLGGLTQREFRAFGAREGAQAASDAKAAEVSRK